MEKGENLSEFRKVLVIGYQLIPFAPFFLEDSLGFSCFFPLNCV